MHSGWATAALTEGTPLILVDTPSGMLLMTSSYGLTVQDATAQDAEWAAARWRPGEGLSPADRFCLALAARLGGLVWTADTAWSDAAVRQIR